MGKTEIPLRVRNDEIFHLLVDKIKNDPDLELLEYSHGSRIEFGFGSFWNCFKNYKGKGIINIWPRKAKLKFKIWRYLGLEILLAIPILLLLAALIHPAALCGLFFSPIAFGIGAIPVILTKKSYVKKIKHHVKNVERMYLKRNYKDMIEKMQCSKCGKEIPGKINYCPDCGNRIRW